MPNKRSVQSVFSDEGKTVSAIKALKGTPWKLDRVHSPFPSHKILDALNLKKSGVGYFTLAGGILGFFTGFGLSVYTSVQWNLIISGKPVVSWMPFVIVGFEFTILFSVLCTILGFLIQSGMPEFKGLKQYDPRFSGDHFGIVASCEEGEQAGLMDFFQEKGGEVKTF